MATQFNNGYALIIGAGNDLKHTISDAEGLYNIVTDPGRCAFPKDQVRILADAGNPEKNILPATRSSILDEGFQWLYDKTEGDADAKVIVFFSGHGTKRPNAGIVPFDGSTSNNRKSRNNISENELSNQLKKIKAKELLVFFDCCWAASVAIVKGKENIPFESSAIPANPTTVYDSPGRRLIIGSSRSDEVSLIFRSSTYSVFTEALIEALSGVGSRLKDGKVYVGELITWIGNRVVDKTNHKQNPIIHAKEYDANAHIAYYAGGDIVSKGVDWEVEGLETLSPIDPLQAFQLFEDEELGNLVQDYYDAKAELAEISSELVLEDDNAAKEHLLATQTELRETVNNLKAKVLEHYKQRNQKTEEQFSLRPVVKVDIDVDEVDGTLMGAEEKTPSNQDKDIKMRAKKVNKDGVMIGYKSGG